MKASIGLEPTGNFVAGGCGSRIGWKAQCVAALLGFTPAAAALGKATPVLTHCVRTSTAAGGSGLSGGMA